MSRSQASEDTSNVVRSIFPARREWKRWGAKERLAYAASWAAILGLLVTLVVLMWENHRLKQVSLYVEVGGFVGSLPIEIRPGYGNHVPPQVTFAYSVALINDNIRPVIVTGYDLTPINCDYRYPWRGQDGDQGLFAEADDHSPVRWPVTMQSGESRTFFLKTATVLSDDALDIATELSTEGNIQDVLIHTIMRRNRATASPTHRSYDFFGNEVDYGVGVRGVFDWSHMKPQNLVQPVYRIAFHTSRGPTTFKEFAPFGLENTAPFSRDCADVPFGKSPLIQLNPDAPRIEVIR